MGLRTNESEREELKGRDEGGRGARKKKYNEREERRQMKPSMRCMYVLPLSTLLKIDAMMSEEGKRKPFWICKSESGVLLTGGGGEVSFNVYSKLFQERTTTCD